MKIDLKMINWDYIFTAIKWGAMLGSVLYVIHFIKESGRNEIKLETTQQTVKVLEQKNEIKDEVHQVINRVTADPDYRDRVRELYDTRPAK